MRNPRSRIDNIVRRSAQKILDSGSINPQAELRPGTIPKKLSADVKAILQARHYSRLYARVVQAIRANFEQSVQFDE